jgi:hypothetical protein
MITTWRILWIPVGGAILILNAGDCAPRLLSLAGAAARYRSVRPVTNVWAVEKVESRLRRGRATVIQRLPVRRSSATTSPARPGWSWRLSVSTSPATANVAVLLQRDHGPDELVDGAAAKPGPRYQPLAVPRD